MKARTEGEGLTNHSKVSIPMSSVLQNTEGRFIPSGVLGNLNSFILEGN
jgi:hypothetical protein